MAEPEQKLDDTDLLATSETHEAGRETRGMWIGAAVGFGIGAIFALGGFWAGIVCLIFTVAGAVIGRLLLTS